MVLFLQHHQIDRQRWDELISSSPQRLPYATGWYLDCVAPGWNALAEEDFSAVMPLPEKRKLGIRYIPKPWYTQQLGVFGKQPTGEQQIKSFLDAIPPDFRLADLPLNAMNPLPAGPYQSGMHTNLELDMGAEFSHLSKVFSENTKRNLLKASRSGLYTKVSGNPEFILEAKWNDRPSGMKREQLKLAGKIIQEGLKRNAGELWEVINAKGEKLAAVFFLKNDCRSIYLISASTGQGKEQGAMFFLLAGYIEQHAGSRHILDFEGSSVPGIARFFKGFGATDHPYPLVRINRLPFPLKYLIR